MEQQLFPFIGLLTNHITVDEANKTSVILPLATIVELLDFFLF